MQDRKILVVDDEVTILMLLKEVFEERGYEVVTASKTRTALCTLRPALCALRSPELS